MIKGGSEFLNCKIGRVLNTFLFQLNQCSRETVLNCRQTSLLQCAAQKLLENNDPNKFADFLKYKKTVM